MEPQPVTNESTDRLLALEQAEAENLSGIKQVLGSTWPLAGEISVLYSHLCKCLWDGDPHGPQEKYRGVTILLLSAERSAALGLLDVGRLHFTEATAKLRRAIEFVGFARIVWKDPVKLTAWVNSAKSGDDYATYRKLFEQKSLLRELSELHTDLPRVFDVSSKIVHGSILSVAPSYEQSGRELAVHFFDFRQGSVAPVALQLLNALANHLRATSGFVSRSFVGSSWRDARKAWRQRYEPLATRFASERDRWKPAILKYQASLPRPLERERAK